MSKEDTVIGRPLNDERTIGNRRGKAVLTLALEKFGFEPGDVAKVIPDANRKGDVTVRIKKKR